MFTILKWHSDQGHPISYLKVTWSNRILITILVHVCYSFQISFWEGVHRLYQSDKRVRDAKKSSEPLFWRFWESGIHGFGSCGLERVKREGVIFAFLVPSSAHFRVCPSVPQSFPGVVSACRDYAFHFVLCFRGLRASLVAQLVENPPAVRATWDRSWVEKIPWRRETRPTPVFWPGELHGLYSPLGCKESHMTERISLTHLGG